MGQTHKLANSRHRRFVILRFIMITGRKDGRTTTTTHAPLMGAEAVFRAKAQSHGASERAKSERGTMPK